MKRSVQSFVDRFIGHDINAADCASLLLRHLSAEELNAEKQLVPAEVMEIVIGLIDGTRILLDPYSMPPSDVLRKAANALGIIYGQKDNPYSKFLEMGRQSGADNE